ncbi:sensor histidine kinase [Robinsoniella peoriensis]
MDKGSNQRVGLLAGLLFLVILGCVAASIGWIYTVHREDQKLLGQCILLEPKTEGAYVSIFKGKTGVDSRQAVSAGKEAAEKYGYVFDYRTLPHTITSFLPVILLGFVLMMLFIGGIAIFQRRRFQRAELKIFELDDRLEQLDEENRILREKMKREEAETKALVTDISHQLKTPLASLKMCYEIADTGSFTREEQQSFLLQGFKEVDKLENLTKSLIQLSRLEANMIQIEKKQGSLKKTLLGAVNGVYMKAYEKNISISVNEFEDEEVLLDSRWTQEALLNVLDNAVKYSEGGTAVEIRVMPMVSYFLIEIEDQGMGIPKEEMHQVFKRFYRGSAQAVQETEGSGVGLYLARKILEDQGGSIRVKKGKKGCVFQITFPRKMHSTH